MERKPMTRQRSEWREIESTEILGVTIRAFVRNVNDGRLAVLVGDEPSGWHMSISHRGHNDKLIRYPRWDEIAAARDQFLDADIEFVMFLPRADEYVTLHDTTFHIHEHPVRVTEQ